jgi:signal transduction histidine kinase
LTGGLASRLTLVQRFALVSLVILLVGAYIIGRFVADEIEDGVIARSSAITALYVDSFVSPRLQDMSGGAIAPETRSELDQLLTESSLGREIASFKVWDEQGNIVYARDPVLVGQRFELEGGLAAALVGDVHSGLSNLGEEEHGLERARYDRLLETYAPVREDETGAIIGAMEFYQDPSDLESEIASSQRTGWIIVGVSTAGMYLLLVGLVKGASNTLSSQHRHLGRLAQENARLAQRVRKAAAEKTETDEQQLMRISHSLHDGPAQPRTWGWRCFG